MKMIISKDVEARNFVVQLFPSFEVLFVCYLLLKYQLHRFMWSAIFCLNLALKMRVLRHIRKSKIKPRCCLKETQSKVVTCCYSSTLLTWITNSIACMDDCRVISLLKSGPARHCITAVSCQRTPCPSQSVQYDVLIIVQTILSVAK